jgi:signal transduction histidine kinase
MQIRSRLTLQFIFITAGIFILALFFIYLQFRNHTRNEFFMVLESNARMTADMILRYEDELKPLAVQNSREGSSHKLPYSENIMIYNNAFQRVFAINAYEAPLATKTLETIRKIKSDRFVNGKFEAFGALVTSPSGREYIVVSEGVFDDSRLRQLRNILSITFLLIIGSVAAGGWFYAGQALRPVSKIVEEVDGLLPTDLSKRVRTSAENDELSHLVTTFNHLLDRIEHAFRMQRSFISNVSHELKNPLAAMDAQLQLALHKSLSPDDYQQILKSLHDDVRGLTDTAEKLLQLAKLNSEAAEIVFSDIRLDEIILQSRDMLQKMHPEYAVVLEIKDMPESEELLLIKANEPLLRTALLNLFDNGCKFSPDHKVRVNIRFSDKGAHTVCIQDNGPGIPAQDLKRIFEPFFRSTSNMHIKGSGVGLSLVESILRLHKISIDVESGIGNGTIFKLRFAEKAR